MLLAAFVVTLGMRDPYNPALFFAGFQVYVLDVLCVAFLLVGFHRALTMGARNIARSLALALVLLFVINVSRGVLDFGLQIGVNSGRASLYFLAPLVYASTIPHGWDVRVWRLVAATGAVLVGIAFFYFATEGILGATQQVLRNGVLVDSRPVTAAGALVVLESAILLAVLRWPSPRARVWLTVAAVVAIVALQHRTIWVAGLAVALIGFIRWSNHRVRGAESLVFAATGFLFLAMPLAYWGFSKTIVLRTSAIETTRAHSTFQWRLTSWKELILSHHSLNDAVFGTPAGASWARRVGFGVTSVSPHDLYIEQFLRSGLPGVVVLVALGLVLWNRRSEFASRVGLTATCVGLLLLAQFVFTITYSLDAVQGLIIGIFIAALSQNGHRVAGTPAYINSISIGPTVRGAP
jgi:hypothetical protein